MTCYFQETSALESGEFGDAADPVDRAVSPPVSLTPMDVILDFKALDQDHNGEISAIEFMDGLRSNRLLATKFGLSDDILEENGTRARYELTFGTIAYDHNEIVDVKLPSLPEYTIYFEFEP